MVKVSDEATDGATLSRTRRFAWIEILGAGCGVAGPVGKIGAEENEHVLP